MKSKSYFFLLLILSVSLSANAQYPEYVKTFDAKPNSIVQVKGDLSQGIDMPDLSWASRSSTACFPATQNTKFTGNHLFFITELPSRSVMDIELVPKDKTKNMSLYAYFTGTNSNSYPPELSTCVSCEADHKWDYPKKGKTQDHTRHVSLNAVNNPYKVVIGVAGAEGLTKGEFYLKISLK